MVDQSFLVYLAIYSLFLILIKQVNERVSNSILPLTNLIFCIVLFTDFYINPSDDLFLGIIFEILTNIKLVIFIFSLVLSFYTAQLVSNGKRDFGIGYFSPLLLLTIAKIDSTLAIVGASYLSFRLLYLRYEVSVKSFKIPSAGKYIEYACFPLIFPVGPITPFSKFVSPITNIQLKEQWTNVLTRLIAGLIKLLFLGFIPLMAKTQLFPAQTESIHSIVELVLYGSLFYLYVYVNFSGACDIIISVCHLAKIRNVENFNNPMTTRNIQDFWMNWHMSLTNMIRELVFSPLYLILKRKSPTSKWFPLLSSSLILFLAVGLWHGISWSFVLLGIYHAVGVSIFLIFKDKLGKRTSMWAGKWYFKQTKILTSNSIIKAFLPIIIHFHRKRELIE